MIFDSPGLDRLAGLLAALGPHLRIAVIYGGDRRRPGSVVYPTYNVRPWTSYEDVAAQIAASLERSGFRHVCLLPEDRNLVAALQDQRIELAWLNTAGIQGVNPMAHAPSVLEMLGIPYVGHDPLNASRLDNKDLFKREVQALGFVTPPFVACPPGSVDPLLDARFLRTFGESNGPFVVKPASGRASVLVSVVDDAADLHDAIRQIHDRTRHTALIERYLPGREFCVAVGGPVVRRDGRLTRLDQPFAFAPIERLLDPHERIFTSKDVRPISASRAQVLDPDGQGELRTRLLTLGQDLYRAFGLGYLIRLDLREDDDGNLSILEANAKPDLQAPSDESTSLIALGLTDSGLRYDDLLYGLLASHLDRIFSGAFGDAHSHLGQIAGLTLR